MCVPRPCMRCGGGAPTQFLPPKNSSIEELIGVCVVLAMCQQQTTRRRQNEGTREHVRQWYKETCWRATEHREEGDAVEGRKEPTLPGWRCTGLPDVPFSRRKKNIKGNLGTRTMCRVPALQSGGCGFARLVKKNFHWVYLSTTAVCRPSGGARIAFCHIMDGRVPFIILKVFLRHYNGLIIITPFFQHF